MDNYYQYKKKKNQLSKSNSQKSYNIKNNINIIAQLKQQHQIENQKKLNKALNQGTIPLDHPNFHEFRKRDVTKEINQKQFFNYNFQPSKQRAQEINNYHKSLYIEEIQNKQITQKTSSPSKAFRFNHHNQYDRVNSAIQQNEMIDYSEKNTKLIHQQQFREENPQKWLGSKFSFKKHQSISEWNDNLTIPSKDLIKKVEKDDSKKRFISTVAPDRWKDMVQQSKSIRTFFQDKATQIEPYFYKYSKNGKLKDKYSNGLIITSSMDGQIPFIHSQNKDCKNLYNFRPNQPYFFNYSIRTQTSDNKYKYLKKKKKQLSQQTFQIIQKPQNNFFQQNNYKINIDNH